MSSYVLVHGAWHGAWCWNKLAPLLKSAGHHVSTPDLPGYGDDNIPAGNITTSMYVNAVSQTVLEQNQPVTLVGHSMAGMIISQVAEHIPDQIKNLVYVTGFLLENGECIRDIESRVTGSLVSPRLVLSPDKRSLLVPPDIIREAFYGDCTDAEFDFASSRLQPQPILPFITPIHITRTRFGSIPRHYIECLLDRALPVSAQKAMYQKAGCETIHTLDAGHAPFFSKHRDLAEILSGI